MPVSRIQVPDGRILDIEHPAGASERDLFAFASMQASVAPPPYTPEIPAMTEQEEEEPGFFEDVKELGQRTLGSAASILAEAPAGIQSMFREGVEEDEELVERNRKIRESISSALGYDQEYDDSLLGLSSNVLGSILGFGGATIGAGATGAALGSAIFPGAGTLVGGVIGLGTGALLGAGSNVASGMEETARQIERGQIVTDDDYESATARLAGIGASEGLPFIGPAIKVLRRISGAARKNPKAVEKLTDYIRSAAIQGTEEAAQEALAGIASDAVLKEYINPDIEIGDSLGVDLVAGGLGGALFDVGINLATRRRRSGGVDDEVKPLREELVAEEEALRFALEQNEVARQERISARFATTPEIEIDQVDTIFPEAVDIAGLIPVSQVQTPEGRTLEVMGDAPTDPEIYRGIARDFVRQLGDQFPTELVFEVKEIKPGFSAIVDDKGKIYGTTAQGVPTELASRLNPLAVALNAQTIEEKIYQNNRIIISESKEDYTPDQIKTLQRLGRIALGPESLSYSSEAANYAGGTTEENGFLPQLSPENVIENNIPRKKQTIAQRINVKRIKNGQLPTNRFALSEIRREIGADVGRLAEYEAGAFGVDTYRALPMPINGKYAVVAEALSPDGRMEQTGEIIYDRPATLAERQAAREEGKKLPKRVKFSSARDAAAFAQAANLRKGQADIPSQDIMGDPEFGVDKIKELLRQKNISSDINSKEIKSLAARFTGNKLRRDQGINALSPAERQLLYQKLRQLPRFESPTKIPEFRLLKPKEPEAVVEEGVQQEPIAALPSPSTPAGMDTATKGMLERAISSRLKQLGLSDISGVITDLVRDAAKDADGNVILGPVAEDADLTVEGGYTSGGASRVLQVAMDAIMARANKPEDVEAAVIDVLNHEVVHALRNLDVITQSELQLLERLAGKYRKVDGGQTYVDWARSAYEKGNPVMVMEEAIAEMIRDGISGRVVIDNKPAKITGKPRAIFNKIVKFFKGMFGVAKDVDQDYASFTQFLNDLEAGRIGERERGQVRTLYRLEQVTGQFVDRRAPIEPIAETTTVEVETPRPAERETQTTGGTAAKIKAEVPESEDLMEEAGLDDLMFSRRLERAEEQGFDTSEVFYHGSVAYKPIEKFQGEVGRGAIAGHFTRNPELASAFAQGATNDALPRPTIYPVFLKKGTGANNQGGLFAVRQAEADGALQEVLKAVITPFSPSSSLGRDLSKYYERQINRDFVRVQTEGMNEIMDRFYGGEISIGEAAVSLAREYHQELAPLYFKNLKKSTYYDDTSFEELEIMAPYIKDAGFIGYYDIEEIRAPYSAIAMFNAGDVKGVFADYDPTGVPEGALYEDDIMFSRRSDMPPPENAQRTQISGTLPTYRKATDILDKEASGDRSLDFGAGLGLGAQEFGYDSYEPFPREGFSPTYTSPDQIEPRSYDKIVNLNVLNVVPRDARDRIVKDIGTALDAGGVAIITARGKDVLNANGKKGPEPTSVITTRGTYQKGFSRKELVDYLRETLGPSFEVSPLNLGPAGAIVRRTDFDSSSFSKRGDTKHGIPREYIVSSRGQVSGKPALPKAINPKNGEAQAQKLAELAERHPDPLSSKAAWLKFERDLLGDNETPSAPTGLINLYNDMDSWVERHEQLTPEQLTAAGEGFDLVEDMSRAYENGDATVDTTGKLMLWGILSRMLSAHPHESAFLDAAVDKKLSEFISRAVEREWTQADIDEYFQWADTVIPDFAPSKQGTSNLRSFGGTFLPKMSKRMPSGKSALEELHDLIADKSVPTSDIRAKYYGLNQGMGIQNKVLSFVLLMTGRKDVVILDRIQINSMWDAGRFGKLIYDDVASLFEGAHGLARYEALERSLASKIQGLYDRIGRPEDASVGRYHWESWVRDSGQVVSHPTIKGMISETKGDQPLASSYADIGAPEGRFHQFAFGSVYARDANGTPYIMYADSNGVPHKFGLKRFKDFLNHVKKPSSGVIPAKFSVKSYKEAGYPWYQSEEVNRERLDQIIQDFSEGATTTEAVVSDAIESEGKADVAGQRPSDADILGEDQVAFSRRAADRNVERASQKAVDDVLSYAEKSEPDAIGVETLRYGPLAYSRNAGYSDQNGAAPTFTSPSRSWFNKLVFEVQDKLTDLRAIEDAINESRKARGLDPIPVSESAYTGEETIAGKIAAFNRAFEKNELEPLIKEMSDKDVSIEQMDEFLVLRHAIERNERIRKINPSMPDAGSGKWNGQELTDNYVKSKMLADFGMEWDAKSGTWKGGNARAKTLSELASRLDKINSTTLAINEKGGLITEQDRKFLDSFYKYYTPLRGISQEEDVAAETSERTAGSGGSLSTVGKETKRAMGRATEAVSPMATIISSRGTQVARAIKNTSFGNRLVDLIKKNPNDDVWQLISPDDPKYKRMFDSTYTYVGPDSSRYGERKRDISGESDKKNWVKRVKVVQDPVLNPYAEELLGVKVDGQQYYVLFNNPDLRKAAINLDAQSTSIAMNALSSMTRWMSYVNTSLNPEFVVGNFARDVQTAIANIIGEQTMEDGKALGTKKMVRQVLKRTLPSIGVFYKGITNPEKLSGQDAIDFNEFIKTGSKTDWFHSLPPEQQKQNIAMMIEMANGTFKGNAAKGFSAVKSFVDDTNNAVENGVRLATFVAARDSFIDAGIPRELAIQQASTLAKNLTVNFNRRGNSGQLLNSLYLFFNASVQGTVNTMRGLNVFDPNSSRTKQGIVAAIMGFGALMAALGDMALEDDEFEDIEEYIRDRNIVIPHAFWGGDPKLYSTIPLPYGYNVFYNMGENAYLVAAGKKSPEDAAVRASNVFLGSFSPLGTSSSETFLGSAFKTATPQFGKPLVELVMNENYFGSPIYPPESPYGVDAPASRRSFSNTAQVWKNITETLASITGGNESEPGLLEVPPDSLSYLLNYGFGGAGSFVERTFFKVPPAMIDESVDLEVRDIPFVRRVLGEINSRADSEKFYERRETLQRKDMQANDILRGKERNDYLKENSAYMKMVPILSGTDKNLRELRRQLRQIKELKNVSPQRAIELANKEKLIQDRIDKLIDRFNSRYDAVVGKTK